MTLVGCLIQRTPLFLVLFLTSTTLAEQAPKTCTPRRIGVVVPLSGGAASNGTAIKNSIVLADQLYDRADCVRFLFEDDQFKPQKTVSAVKKLITVDKVDGLLVFGSPTSLAVNGIAERHQLPMIGLSIVEQVVKDKRFVVKHWVTSKREHEVLIDEVRRCGYRSVAIVSTTNDAMIRLRDHFVESKVSKIVLDEQFVSEDNDFRAVAARIKQINPDAVYILLWAPQPSVFARMLRANGYQGALFGAHNLEDPREIEASQGTLTGAWYVTGDDTHAASYYELYKSSFGEKPATGGINGYDSAKLFIEAVKTGNINSYLHTVDDFGGAYGTYGATGYNDFDIGATIKVIASDGFSSLDHRGQLSPKKLK